MKAIARALASLQAKQQQPVQSHGKHASDPEADARQAACKFQEYSSDRNCKQDSGQQDSVAAACRRNGFNALHPSQQSSAAQTPVASRGGSGEHERGRSSANTATTSSSARTSLESRMFFRRNSRPNSLDALSTAQQKKPSSTWFSRGVPSKQQENEEVSKELQQEPPCHVPEECEQQQHQPERADALLGEAGLGVEPHGNDEFPSLKSIIGSMRLHIDHPVAHPSNERGCVFKAYWSNACVAAKISVSAQPPSMQVATGPTGAEFNHPNIVQTFESRTGRVSKQFLQSPCALSAFSSCSEAMEQLCPIGVMKAELAAAGMSAEAIEAELAAVGATPGVNASTAAAAALLGARSTAASACEHAVHHHPQQQQSQTGADGEHPAPELHAGVLPAGAGGHARAGDVEMTEVAAALGCERQQEQGALREVAALTCWSDNEDSAEERVDAAGKGADKNGQEACDRDSGSASKGSSVTQMLFDSGDGFGPPNKASVLRTPPTEWGQIMKAAGVQAGDYVTLTLMDWCDCGSLHHAMAHAVFSLAPSRPPSSCGTPEVPPTPSPTAETAQLASQMDTESAECPLHVAPSAVAPTAASCMDESIGTAAYTGAVTAEGRTMTAGSSSDGGSGSAEAGMCGVASSSSGESSSGSSSTMRGMRTRYRGLLRTARDIAQGLEYLHCCGIVHGALEPSNVLLKGSPTDARGFVARLSNFNTSLASATAAPTEFTAPEIKEGKATSIHPAADMWSFGALLRVMVNRSLEAAHPGHDFGYTFSDSEARPPAARSPQHGSITPTTTTTANTTNPTTLNTTTTTTICSGMQDAVGAVPAALIPQELTDLYHRCVRADPAERPTAHEAVVVLVTMEMRLRSKLSKQVWLQQQALERQWEEQAKAVQLQLQQAQAAQWAQTQPWAAANQDAPQLDVRRLQQQRLQQQVQLEQQLEQQQQQQQQQGHSPQPCDPLHSQQQQQQQGLELTHEHCAEHDLLLREQEHKQEVEQKNEQEHGRHVEEEGACGPSSLNAPPHSRQHHQSNHDHHHHHHHRQHRNPNQHYPAPSTCHHHHHHHHHHPPAQSFEQDHQHQKQEQQHQQLLLLQGQPHNLLQHPSMYPHHHMQQHEQQQERLQGLLQRLDAQHQQQYQQQQQQHACYPTLHAAGPSPLAALLAGMPAAPAAAAVAAAAPAASHASGYGCSRYTLAGAMRTHASAHAPGSSRSGGSATPTPAGRASAAAPACTRTGDHAVDPTAMGALNSAHAWARMDAAVAATAALLNSPRRHHAGAPSKVISFGSSAGGASPSAFTGGSAASVGRSWNGSGSKAASSMSTGYGAAGTEAGVVHTLASCAARGTASLLAQPAQHVGQQQQKQQQQAEQWARQELAIQVLSQQVEALRKYLQQQQQQQQQQQGLGQEIAELPLQRRPWDMHHPHPPVPPNTCTLSQQPQQQQQQQQPTVPHLPQQQQPTVPRLPQQQQLPMVAHHALPQPLPLGTHAQPQQQQQQQEVPSAPLTAAMLARHNKHYQQQERQQQQQLQLRHPRHSLPHSPLPLSQGRELRERHQCQQHAQQQQQQQQLTAAALKQHLAAQQRQQQQLTDVAMQLHVHLHRQLHQPQQHQLQEPLQPVHVGADGLCKCVAQPGQVAEDGLAAVQGCGAACAVSSGVLQTLGGQRLLAAERAVQEATRAARAAGQAVTEAVEAASAAKLAAT